MEDERVDCLISYVARSDNGIYENEDRNAILVWCLNLENTADRPMEERIGSTVFLRVVMTLKT